LFKGKEVTEQVLKISKDIESQLDTQMQNKHKKVDKNIASLLSGELELNGRRLIVIESLSKNDATKKATEEVHNKPIDRRNIDFQ
jgi:hypothetical protein